MRTYRVTTWLNTDTNVKRYGIAIDGRDMPVTYPRRQDARDYIARSKAEAAEKRPVLRLVNSFEGVAS